MFLNFNSGTFFSEGYEIVIRPGLWFVRAFCDSSPLSGYLFIGSEDSVDGRRFGLLVRLLVCLWKSGRSGKTFKS
jgi:hypothetical protein